MLDLLEVVKSYGGQEVLCGVSLRIAPGERWALVGANGSGKTTLLRIIAGQETPDAGQVTHPRRMDVGYLPQELDVSSEVSLLSYVEDVAADVQELREEIRAIETRLAAGDHGAPTLDRYGLLQARFEHLGGYQLKARAERILLGLGFGGEDFHRALAAFSGGWRMRAALARILLREPDLVLLDEPTNHLDIGSLEWLEEFIRESRNAYLIVSHDVSFLDRVVTGVLALEGGSVVRTKGNYSRYVEQKDLRRGQMLAEYENYQKRKAATQAFADRFRYKATKARQVQSRLRQLEKESPPPPPPASGARLTVALPQPERSGKEVVAMDAVTAGYGDVTVYRDVSLRVDRGERVVLIGPNGAGKSTLLKLLAGVVQPRAGTIRYGHNVCTSYFAQHQLEQLDAGKTVLEELRSVFGFRTETDCRNLLGAFLFSGDSVDKPVAVLSGGEKTRLALAKLLADPGNFLLLDEPTNHLDIEACAVLKAALEGFGGTICLITHDRDLINRVATRVLFVEPGRLREYAGNYDDYLRAQAREAPGNGPGAGSEGVIERAPARGRRKDLRREEARRREEFRRATAALRVRVAELEEEIGRAEARLTDVESELSVPGTYAEGDRAAALSRERAELVQRLATTGAEWEQAATELEALERERQGTGS